MADTGAVQSLLASCGASKEFQEEVRHTLCDFHLAPACDHYELISANQDLIVKWVVDYFFGNEKYPYPYVPTVARVRARTREERITNGLHDSEVVGDIQPLGVFIENRKPQKTADGNAVCWSSFPRFYVVPSGYPMNNVEEKFAELVSWQIVCFQQRASTLNASYIKLLNATAEDWLMPDHQSLDLSYQGVRSLYLAECDVVAQRAEENAMVIIEKYLVKLVHEANVFTKGVQEHVNAADDQFQDYKNLQVNNAISNTYGFVDMLKIDYMNDLDSFKEGMSLPNAPQFNIDNKARCQKIDWGPAFNWLGIVMSLSLSVFAVSDAGNKLLVQIAANDPETLGVPPRLNPLFFSRSRLVDFINA